jgi:hypothetical protein
MKPRPFQTRTTAQVNLARLADCSAMALFIGVSLADG